MSESEGEQPDTSHPDPELLAEQLAEVSFALASMSLPTLPDAFTLRISAAIAAESATRTDSSGTVGGSATVRSIPAESSPAAVDSDTTTAPPARPRMAGARRGARRPGTSRAPRSVGPRSPGKWRRRLTSPSVLGSLVICLVLAGFGVLLTRAGGSSSSSSSMDNSAAAPASSSVGSPANGLVVPYSGSVPAKSADGSSRQPDFTVTETGTRYAAATLATQVHDELNPAHSASASSASSASTAPIASARASSSALVSEALAGCVYRLTGNAKPSLVDRATYAGKQAYIIAVPKRVWVVGLGCTAANPELITTTALTG